MNNKSNRTILFRLMAISFPLLVLFLIEITLRISGYGHSYELFEESKDYPGYYVMNEYASEKFFMNTDKATVGYYEPFSKIKPEDTYRIFVLGESTTVGYPYNFNGSFHRWLKYRLMFTFPDVNFEVINLSLTAVNSYTIADFAEKIVDHEPDAVLIYVGHNEYYGALGVGSTLKIGNNPKIVNGVLKLRQLKLYQLGYKLIQGFGKALVDEEVTKQSLMQHMPEDKQIAFGSKKYQQAIKQFRYNMNRTCEVLEQANIPVLISNLVSNEKDLKPFISDKNSDVSAQSFYEKALKKYDQEEFAEAKSLFVKAKEYDMLRFRAPEAINHEIELLAKAYNKIHLVDSKARFESASPHGIIGKETLLEHVHPNLYGYALLSDAFFSKMEALNLIDSNWTEAMSFEQLVNEMPVNIIDSLKGEYKVRFMLNEWPFTSHPVPINERIQARSELEKTILQLAVGKTSWDKVQLNYYTDQLKKGNIENALKTSEAFALVGPLEERFLNNTALFCTEHQLRKKAAFYFSKAFELSPSVDYAKQLAKLCTDLDKPNNALRYYTYLQTNDGQKDIYKKVIDVLNQIIADKEELSKNEEDVAILNNLAWNYLQIAGTEPSRKYLSLSQHLDPQQKETDHIGRVLLQVEQQIEQRKSH